VQAVTKGFPEVVDTHDLMFKRVGGRLYLSLHCTMQDDLPLSRVHDVQTALEGRFRQEVPELFHVLIHPEPQTDNRR
jgi:divalent metal cation (Fe/Co/Zn/Cd) transporter